MILAFHKPYGVLSQFTLDGSANRPLSEFGLPKDVYAVGRLDADSEGLLILSDEKALVEKLLHPRQRHPRCYWAQVERVPEKSALDQLASGVAIKGHHTAPCRAWLLDPQPVIPPRDPPIRFRKSVPDCWMALELTEGKNRQVRRMGAAVGHPVLRLIRKQIGRFELGDLASGSWCELSQTERAALLARS